MEAGKKVKWRGHFNQLIRRPIPESEFPKICRSMYDDGLIAILQTDGLRWYSGRYLVRKTVVADAWNLSETQMKRLERWVYINDPFMSYYEEE